MKKCYKCGLLKPISAFTKNRTLADGHCSRCRICVNKEYKRDWYLKNKLSCTKSTLKRLYNLTLEKYKIMLKAQNGVCAICEGVNPSGKLLAVDHNHKTGIIRGLLCSRCNTRLAVLDDKDWVIKARRYVS